MKTMCINVLKNVYYICRMKIESGLTMRKKSNAGRPLKYPFDKLELGQCITLEPTDNVVNVTNSAYQYAKRNGVRFKVQKDSDTVRIFRVK